jgi:hypothetical protein
VADGTFIPLLPYSFFSPAFFGRRETVPQPSFNSDKTCETKLAMHNPRGLASDRQETMVYHNQRSSATNQNPALTFDPLAQPYVRSDCTAAADSDRTSYRLSDWLVAL